MWAGPRGALPSARDGPHPALASSILRPLEPRNRFCDSTSTFRSRGPAGLISRVRKPTHGPTRPLRRLGHPCRCADCTPSPFSSFPLSITLLGSPSSLKDSRAGQFPQESRPRDSGSSRGGLLRNIPYAPPGHSRLRSDVCQPIESHRRSRPGPSDPHPVRTGPLQPNPRHWRTPRCASRRLRSRPWVHILESRTDRGANRGKGHRPHALDGPSS